MALKLNWYTTQDGWAADFSSELDLQINVHTHRAGIYDREENPVWEEHVEPPWENWKDLAARAELELAFRLGKAAETLDPSWLQAPEPEPPEPETLVDHIAEHMKAFELPEPEELPSMPEPQSSYCLTKPANEPPSDLYWKEVVYKPGYVIRCELPESGYSQIATMIKTEATTIKL